MRSVPNVSPSNATREIWISDTSYRPNEAWCGLRAAVEVAVKRAYRNCPIAIGIVHGPDMTPQERKDLAVRTMIACLSQDFAVARPQLTPDLQWIVPKSMRTALGPVSGREEFLEACAMLATIFPQGLKIKVHHAYCDDGTVLVEFSYTGTTASGRSYDNDYCVVFIFTGARISTIREYADTKHAADTIFA
jgi:ketosteroid isomerase-like protein